MKNVKLLAIVFSFVMLASAGFAQAQKAAVKGKPVPAVVIVLPGDDNGGVDTGLNSGLENFIGAPLDVKTVNREDALKDPKYKGLNLDYMPLYLIKKTPEVAKKFEEPIKNGYLKTNDDFVIFEKQTRYGVHVGKPVKPNLLEIFVMSQCPYGVMAEGRIIDAQKLGKIPSNIKVNVRYIVSPGANGQDFSSLHGAGEWEEDVRQLIIKDKYPTKFWKYLELRNKNYQSSLWDQAAEEAGLNPNVFRKYWKHGLELLKQDMEYGQQFGVSASPTIIWEGRVVTDLNGLGNIKGLEGLAQTNFGGQPGGQPAPAGQC